MLHRSLAAACLALIAAAPRPAGAQSFTTTDSVIRRIWQEGMERSQTEPLAQVLMDSIGPRLAGSPGMAAAADWLVRTYESWGVAVRKEQYGTYRAWRHGAVHVDLIAPRVETLEAKVRAWSAGTRRPVEGAVTYPPEAAADLAGWLAQVRGKFVLVSAPEPTCRAHQELEQIARPETVERLRVTRESTTTAWGRRLTALGGREYADRLEQAGAAGLIMSTWSGGWGVDKVFGAPSRGLPAVDVGCEDYGLLFRLAAHGQGPRLRLAIESQDLGTAPQFNVIAELPGHELPGEYVILSAHYDSWHAATGATDNGTGTVMMLEAMRLLHAAYPAPRRTILVGHWGGEEVGLVGSRAFSEDHPEVLDGLQALFNQDNGTWRVELLEASGFARAGEHLARWMSLVPRDIAAGVRLVFPGSQENMGSDHASFLCHGVPAFRLQSPYDEYRQYTWHTNRDTYDKIVFDDLRSNAMLAAMLAYAASEDPQRVPRDRAVLPPDPRTGAPRDWVRCGAARRTP
jgi:carboxypeptidase Q